LGSAAAPSISFKGDTNTGIYSPGADTLAISTNGTGRLTIDSSGNINIDSGTVYVDAVNNRLGIGTSAPNAATHIMLSDVAGFNSPLIDGLVVERSGGNDLAITIATDNSRNGCLVFADSNSSNSAWINYDHSVDAMSFKVNANERARIDSSGRLLVGTSSALSDGGDIQLVNASGRARFHRNAADEFQSILWLSKARGTGYQVLSNNDKIGSISFQGADGTVLLQAAAISAEVDGTPGASDMPGRLVFSTTADGASSPTERMRIANQGDIYIHTTTGIPGTGNTNVGAQFERAADGTTLFVSRANSPVLYLNRNSDASLVHFNRSGGTVGYIHVSSTHTTYSTNSDYRLKENVTAVTDGITRLQQLKPSRFNFIADPGKTVDGFIAHEVQTVVPEAITGTKDEVNDKGDPVYQGIDQSKLVPLLTAALQEAIGEIESLKARVAALEST
jgi:hypothetical protein